MTFLPTGSANSFFIGTAIGTFPLVATTILTETLMLILLILSIVGIGS